MTEQEDPYRTEKIPPVPTQGGLFKNPDGSFINAAAERAYYQSYPSLGGWPPQDDQTQHMQAIPAAVRRRPRHWPWWLLAGVLAVVAAGVILLVWMAGRAATGAAKPPYMKNQATACKLLASVTRNYQGAPAFLSSAQILIEQGTGGQAAVDIGGLRQRQFTARFSRDAMAVFETGLNLPSAATVARLQQDCAATGIHAPVWPSQLTGT